MDSIFVSIPTMNDSEYLSTIERLLSSAEFPERIFIGTTIFWQSQDEPIEGAPFFYKFLKEIQTKYSYNVKVDVLPWEKYPGVGKGRTESLKHYNNEKYFLSLDSHTACIKKWDSILIDKYENAKKYFGKQILITTYLPAYFPEDDNETEFLPDGKSSFLNGVDIDNTFNISFIKGDNVSRWQFFDYNHHLPRNHLKDNYIFPFPNDMIISEKNPLLDSLIDKEYLPAKKISAHFTFTESNPWLTAHKICLHPECFFWSEEFYQSSLAYARGYNLVWIKNPIFFHHYKATPINNKPSNYKNNKSIRKIEEIIEYESIMQKVEFYNKYTYEIKESNTLGINSENKIVIDLLKNINYFGYTPRSTISYCKYAKINISKKTCSPWWEIPDINIIFK